MSNWCIVPTDSDLFHHGIKGQKWGVRRYQNKDGTLTDIGKRRQKKDKQFEDLNDEKNLEYNEVAKDFVKKVSKKRLKEIKNSPELKDSQDRIQNYILKDNELMKQKDSIWKKYFNDEITRDKAIEMSRPIDKHRKELHEKVRYESDYIKTMFY